MKCIAKLFPISTKSNQIILKNINLNRNFSLIGSSYFFCRVAWKSSLSFWLLFVWKCACNFTCFMVDWIWSLYLKSCGGKITPCYGAKTVSENSAQEIWKSEQNHFIPASNICAICIIYRGISWRRLGPEFYEDAFPGDSMMMAADGWRAPKGEWTF